MKLITPEVVVAYSHCLRKAFLLLQAEDQGIPHEYVQLLEDRASQNRINYLEQIKQGHPGASAGDMTAFSNGQDVVVAVPLRFDDLAVDCDVLRKVAVSASSEPPRYEPTIVVGTRQITKEQKLELSFVGYLLGQLQNEPPVTGTIVDADLRAHTVSLETADKTLIPTIETLRK